MPVTPEHEARHRVFRFDPALYARAVKRALGLTLTPAGTLTELSIDLTETGPVERRADSVLRAGFPGRDRGPVVIIESQTGEDPERRRRWPYYIAFARDKYDCPVLLLVITSSAATARWARQPIQIGEPGAICMTVTPAGPRPRQPARSDHNRTGGRRPAVGGAVGPGARQQPGPGQGCDNSNHWPPR
ncbi:MAG: hypothetical protein J2P28_04275 [Actinobacteria bacterium]|nr:hypothetical protein [Actinomycetota bacterium]MBO0834724.1 hypothetical protein [Actinomycetota bacterium]